MSGKKTLSPPAALVADLVEQISGGNQRDFARKTGCSQPLISKILSGKQQPGRELLEKMASLDGVDRPAILRFIDVDDTSLVWGEAQVPIAQCLLDGHPEDRRDQLTTNSVVLSRSIYRPSLYAVAARGCEPAFGDPSERMRADDMIVIESSTGRFRKNLQSLNGKLCAVSEGDTITLRRVWVNFDTQAAGWIIRTCPDAKVETLRQDMYGDRLLRSIRIDLPEQQPELDYVDHQVDVGNIVGVAITLLRNL